ncbi:MAG: hypothetical protein KC657_26845, partial [Myxococcales bacterium]|nr:hypothetical protein [Myxococcales bacterium]
MSVLDLVPDEVTLQPPPGQSSVTDAAFDAVTWQLPPGHENVQSPPVHENWHDLPLPPHVLLQSAHVHCLPAMQSSSADEEQPSTGTHTAASASAAVAIFSHIRVLSSCAGVRGVACPPPSTEQRVCLTFRFRSRGIRARACVTPDAG